MGAVSRRLFDAVPADALRHAWDQARAETSARLGARPLSRNPSSAEIHSFVKRFQEIVLDERSAGNVAVTFAGTVLSVIGVSDRLTVGQEKAVTKLCAVFAQRPLPTMAWADFVMTWLQHPAVIGRVLAGCVSGSSDLGTGIESVATEHFEDNHLIPGRPIVVLGYSTAVFSVLHALSARVSNSVNVVLPTHTLPEGPGPDGTPFAQYVRTALQSLRSEIVPRDVAVNKIASGEAQLVLRGCRVIGLRKTGQLEIVGPANTTAYMNAATKGSVPIGLVTGAYKLWSTRIYEKYRPIIVLERDGVDGRNALLSGNLAAWIMTEERVVRGEEFAGTYERNFAYDVPLTAIRDCLEPKYGSFKSLESHIEEVARDLEVGVGAEFGERRRDNLPAHFVEARRYYERTLQKDDAWIDIHLGEYVAIVGKKVVGRSRNYAELSLQVREEFGYGSIFMTRVTRGPRTEYLGAR